MELSPEQQAVVDAPLVPLAVIACAGSGKTATAIHRLIAVRKLLGPARSRVALLSFSNVAVDTFRNGYQALAHFLPQGMGRTRVDIDTLDGFITAHILRPHAHRTMGAGQSAYLVTGNEDFLANYTIRTANYPIPVTQIRAGFTEGHLSFYYDYFGQRVRLDQNLAVQVINRLGRIGAYTHDLGRYWCYRTLHDQPYILQALARCYSQVIVDESQDIGSLHQAILEMLAAAGVQISLIGDPCQSIYEFAGADGEFLRNYRDRPSVLAFSLTRNFRSLPSILVPANHISDRNDEAHRAAAAEPNGAYFIGYSEAELPQLLDAFHAEVGNVGLTANKCAILCRANALAARLAGVHEPGGRGVVKIFAEAALLRDRQRDFMSAYKNVVRAIVTLLDSPPHDLMAKLSNRALQPEIRKMKHILWGFTRNPEVGLPHSHLPADGQWHEHLLERVRGVLERIEQDFGLAPVENLGRKLARNALGREPLDAGADLAADRGPRIRVQTVHQVKGESIDAVLYVATRQHVEALLQGVDTELGRIGYVAVTRARNLLWLGVPSAALGALRPALLAAGFREAGTRVLEQGDTEPAENQLAPAAHLGN
ncbi:MAG TPA: ATP-dependent helicase [Noviherbaspirillum sp.]|uniref:ATP-dependent helicase n=1 Tax=Noviherbaspirillum sp. TaxID=1926288 RepID=UPI002D4AC4E2|nr:ATP-dependent helicase [Noviherbaspirillum sp.]HYD95253.1 ATP-dependent helicase [Noviherbaspirillum sp.]